MIHNRDKNACQNMYKIVKDIMKGKKRPTEYSREKNSENKTSFPFNDGI